MYPRSFVKVFPSFNDTDRSILVFYFSMLPGIPLPAGGPDRYIILIYPTLVMLPLYFDSIFNSI